MPGCQEESWQGEIHQMYIYCMVGVTSEEKNSHLDREEALPPVVWRAGVAVELELARPFPLLEYQMVWREGQI